MSKKDVRQIFFLNNVNIEKIEQKYGIGVALNEFDHTVPENATRIDDLNIVKKTPEIVSFLDESKRVHKCSVSMIDFNSRQQVEKGKYKCFWDKHEIPQDVQPIGCPLRYVSSKATKSYHSEISREQYTISEQITEKRANQISERVQNKLSLERNNYYETDGVFCSFNCCLAYILEPEHKRDPSYRHSEMLLLQMYNDFQGENKKIDNIAEIVPAPHWRLLTDFGGTLNIDKFRESFNKVQYVYHGKINCRSIGRLYEDQIKF